MNEPSVIFENEAILVLNKPPGLVVNRASSVKATTLQDWIERYLQSDAVFQAGREVDPVFAERSGMVHRLDKDTSGVILFAKQPAVMHELLAQFKSREVEKRYQALVHGHFAEQQGIISAPIERHQQRREVFTVSEEGRPSVTHYRVQQEFVGVAEEPLRLRIEEQQAEREYRHLGKLLKVYEGGFSLVELEPKTGRTHQLRVHLKFLHHPIVGDERYVGDKRWKLDRLWCERQWLHAVELRVPRWGSFRAELSEDLQRALSFLQ